ncbi:MAG: ABC transporter permease [Ilumatobacteraceae bacterium]|nr:ABC transporter permease [Ilumatobacteraceae bacterium]
MLLARYVLRRLAISIPVVFIITVIGFVTLAMAPGDQLTARVGPEILSQLSQSEIEGLRSDLGLDKPVIARYGIWLQDVAGGDLGYSVVNKRPVAEELKARIGPTLLLMGTALVIGMVVGTVLGVIAALRQYSALDYLIAGFSTAMVAIPGFVVGLVFIYFFAAKLQWLPAAGMHTPGMEDSKVDLIKHMVMPATILGLALAAPVTRYARASMLEVLNADYIVTARAKGIGVRLVILRHALRNALVPIITVGGLALPDLVAGAVITESIFGWPGMGQLAVKAASSRDASLMMGVILVVAITVLIANLVTDLAYGVADPRIRLVRKR